MKSSEAGSEPAMDQATRDEELRGWKQAVNATLGWAKE